jgi:hypothetical protein
MIAVSEDTMSKVLQWIIGICFVLVTAAIVFSLVAPFVVARMGVAAPGVVPHLGRGFGYFGPGFMFGGRGMMGGFGLPFLGLGMFIIPAIIVIGVIVLIVALFTRRSPAPAAALPTPAASMPSMPAPAAPMTATTPCAHCGQPLEAGWKACPYCGEKI